jgi:hypothetical protein
LSGLSVENKHVTAVAYKMKGGEVKYSPQQALAMKMHVVAFFVPPTSDDTTLEFLLPFYEKITSENKYKAVIVIAHSDTVLETDRRTEIHNAVCQKFSAPPSSVFFLENYLDTKDKQFNVDKNVIRVLFALLNTAEEFIASQRPTEPTEETEDEPAPGSPRNVIIDPEELGRNEKEVLLIENNEMHVHINNLQNQLNALLKQKAALEAEIKDQTPISPRRDATLPPPRRDSTLPPPRSVAQQVAGVFSSFFSIFTTSSQQSSIDTSEYNEVDNTDNAGPSSDSSGPSSGPPVRVLKQILVLVLAVLVLVPVLYAFPFTLPRLSSTVQKFYSL